MSMPKLLIMTGAVLIVIGLLWSVGGRFLHLGRLPGDIVVEKENFRFYFPIVTCLVLSVGLSLVLYLIRWFMK
ncbi:DUF2905 family protein [Paenibacillus ginsengihumi]|jgi:hypothetical protein|uniref:DUF2905 domain-containing protein n=1 Tax=Paenibacillus ginsengihumi TaxID=431596 RepID=UPI000373E714